jgi:hypothetical protein
MARTALVVKQQKLEKIREKYLNFKENRDKMTWEEKYKLYKKYK